MSKYKLTQKEKPKKFYICDPKKNTECRGNGVKGWCMVECFCTTSPWLAEDGKKTPISTHDYYEELAKRRMGEKNESKNAVP